MLWKLILPVALVVTPLAASAQIIEQAATPRTNPETWLKNGDDYPEAIIRTEIEATVRALLNVDANGRVSECRIVVSSGWLSMDRVTCALAQRRGRFEPARDRDDKPVADVFLFSHTWLIPKE